MARDISAYLCDIIDACDSIASILEGISFEAFAATREKRSAVEREFILIGEATSVLAKSWPDSFNLLSDGRKAIGFRNILTHNYASVDHETVYETALQDVPKLRRECVEILRETKELVNNDPEERSGADSHCHSTEPPPNVSCPPPNHSGQLMACVKSPSAHSDRQATRSAAPPEIHLGLMPQRIVVLPGGADGQDANGNG